MPKTVAQSEREFQGKELRRFRRKRGWSQDVLAQEMGLNDKSIISKWENERETPYEYRVAQLSEIFKTPEESFFKINSDDNTLINDTGLLQQLEIVIGHEQSFEMAREFITENTISIQVYVVGPPRSPSWWREHLKQCHIDARQNGRSIESEFFLYVDLENVAPETLQELEIMAKIFTLIDGELRILNHPPHLGIDILVVDRMHLFCAFYALNLDKRLYGLHFHHPGLAQAVSRWFSRLRDISKPYDDWKNYV